METHKTKLKKETSAGGVIVRPNGKDFEVLVVRDMNEELTFPKGVIEEGENALDAAFREIEEEVGLCDITLIRPLTPISYMYSRDGVVHKVVQYFLFMTIGTEETSAQKDEGIHDVTWMRLDEAIDAIGYRETNKKVLLEVKAELGVEGTMLRRRMRV
ncbi:NUDIX domain-containing protein [Candidatus Gottesmanbacteria bacterium]|nr:NUDIX domain-containing protein [Candidatus Gottesmanbacteria bacterium]